MKKKQAKEVKVLTGSFAKTPLPQVLQVIDSDGETATLVSIHWARKRALFFDGGLAVDVETSVEAEQLVEAPALRRRLTPDQRRETREKGAKRGQATLLASLGIVAASELERLVNEQIRMVAGNLFRESDGKFKLLLGETSKRPVKAKVPVSRLILAGVRLMEPEKIMEWLGEIKRKRISIRPGAKPDPEWGLGEKEMALIGQLKKRSPYSAALDAAGADAPLLAALLYGLEVIGYLGPGAGGKAATGSKWRKARLQGRVRDKRRAAVAGAKEKSAAKSVKKEEKKPDTEEPGVPAEVAALTLDSYKELSEMNHYEVLGLKRIASGDAIRQSFLFLAKRFHPDRFFQQGAEAQKRASKIFEAQNRAYRVLRTPRNRDEYDLLLQQGGGTAASKKEVKIDPVEEAKRWYSHAERSLAERDSPAAVDALLKAVELDPRPARYWGRLAELEMRFARWRNAALEHIRRAIDLQPKNPNFHCLLGTIQHQRGDDRAATHALREALTLDPSNQGAQTLLDKIEAKSKKEKGGFFGKYRR